MARLPTMRPPPDWLRQWLDLGFKTSMRVAGAIVVYHFALESPARLVTQVVSRISLG